jgi:hypothetical protein
MIRFLADTWRDAILRPLAMAAPNTSVYVEIHAPDFRFVLAFGLAMLVLISIRKTSPRPNGWLPTLALFVLIFLSFFPWMLTTGNGRYFMPYLVLIGPLCVGLINLLQNTRNMKTFLIFLVIGIQGIALHQNNPWKPIDSWEWLPWNDAPYFSLELPEEKTDRNTTYLTIALPTFSLAAPLFPVSSRWINLATLGNWDPVKKLLRETTPLKLFIRSSPRAMINNSDQPNLNAINILDAHLKIYNLRLIAPSDCSLLRSKTLSSRAFVSTDEANSEKKRIIEQTGFWICSVEYFVAPPNTSIFTAAELSAKRLIEKMEKICPRFFKPQQQNLTHHSAGFQRRYSDSDSYLIATIDGHLYFKYDRALNPQLIGKAEDVLSTGFTFDCTKFKGRAGLPWEREI